ncbi:FUSC family protein, partial [Phyllobacterium sp. P5_D12]
MQSGPTPSLIDQRLITFVGFSVQAWSFAGRTWLSLILALFVAFWLELESPASAALTVASLSFPSRGQGLEKAFYRVIATIIGVIASIVITALFSETGWLLLFVLATWVGLCVYMASLFDGFRTYAAVLCIITVCLIAVEQLDTPQNVFILGLQRGAAIVVGILSLSLINAVFSAPNYYPAIADRLENLRRDIAELTKRSIAGDSIALETVGALLHRITALRPEITTLSTETSVGRNRSAAARTAMVDLIFELAATRTVASLRAAVQPLLSDDSASHADRNATENRFFNLKMRAMNWMVSEAWRRDCSVSASIRALRQGMLPLNSRRAPFYRSHRIALENGLRAFVYFGLAALVLVIAGWPATNVSLAFVGILIGLSAMSSDQSAASMLALFAVPFGCLLAGILEFVVLNGVTAYPLLAIGFLPFVIFPALLMTIPSPGLISFARSNL